MVHFMYGRFLEKGAQMQQRPRAAECGAEAALGAKKRPQQTGAVSVRVLAV